jgi:CheY-like chemotaxis protein
MLPVQTILVVEDDEVVRALTVEVLEALGYTVLSAASASQALQTLDGELQINLLMTDVGLPDMSGQQLAHAARERRPALPILFASGYVQNGNLLAPDEAPDAATLTPPFALIAKPFTLDQLRHQVAEMLDSASLAEVAAKLST